LNYRPSNEAKGIHLAEGSLLHRSADGPAAHLWLRLSEEYDPVAKRLVGNFPQGFSHLSVIVTAFNLAHTEKPAQQRAKDGQRLG
jgi:hypothetical protein